MTRKQIESFLYGVFDMLACQESEELQYRFDEVVDDERGEPGGLAQSEIALRDMRWSTFREDGVMTEDKGIVVRFGTGDTFHITIQRS